MVRIEQLKQNWNRIIGVSCTVMDYNNEKGNYNGFWDLSNKTRMNPNISCLVASRVITMDQQFRKSIEAQLSFTVIDMNHRLVKFRDLSYGNIFA